MFGVCWSWSTRALGVWMKLRYMLWNPQLAEGTCFSMTDRNVLHLPLHRYVCVYLSFICFIFHLFLLMGFKNTKSEDNLRVMLCE